MKSYIELGLYAFILNLSDRITRLRRTCKIALSYIAETRGNVVFVLDGIDFKKFLEYEEAKQSRLTTVFKSITQSELNYLIRLYHANRKDAIFDRIELKIQGKSVPFPWNETEADDAGITNFM